MLSKYLELGYKEKLNSPEEFANLNDLDKERIKGKLFEQTKME